jgi:hypothetical protein
MLRKCREVSSRRVHLPKKPEAKPKSIEVKVN